MRGQSSTSARTGRGELRTTALWAVAGALITAAIAHPARAQQHSSQAYIRARLLWPRESIQSACFHHPELRSAVEALVERPVFADAGKPDTFIELNIEAQRPGWLTTIRRYDPGGRLLGERVLRSPDDSCESLLGSAALVMAMLVDRHRERASIRLPEPAAPLGRQAWSGAAMMGARASYGLLPSWAFAPIAGAEVTPPGGWPLRGSLAVWPGADQRERGVGAQFHAWQAGIAVAPPVAERGTWLLGTWLGLGVGQLVGQGVGLQVSRERSHVWAHAEAGMHAAQRISGPFWLRLEAGLVVPWNRPRFVYSASDGSAAEVYRPSAVAPVVGVGLEARFGP